MSHGTTPDPGELLDPRAAGQVAETMQALATPSRLRILACLHEGPRSVSEISAAVGMDGSAVSHQLRILRHLGLVTGERDGRRVNYSLYDHHVGAAARAGDVARRAPAARPRRRGAERRRGGAHPVSAHGHSHAAGRTRALARGGRGVRGGPRAGALARRRPRPQPRARRRLDQTLAGGRRGGPPQPPDPRRDGGGADRRLRPQRLGRPARRPDPQRRRRAHRGAARRRLPDALLQGGEVRGLLRRRDDLRQRLRRLRRVGRPPVQPART